MNKFTRKIIVDQLFRNPSTVLNTVTEYLKDYFKNHSVEVSYRVWDIAVTNETVVIELDFYNEQEYLLFTLKHSNRIHTVNDTIFLKNDRLYTDFKL